MSVVGTGIALLTALAWAASNTIVKFLTAKIDTLSLNALRLWFGSIPILSFVFIWGRGFDLIHTPFLPLFFVATSGVLALAVGDTIFIKSLTFIDVSRAFPITQCTFLLLTMTVALLFLQESFTWFNLIGAILVMAGVYFVAVAGKEAKTSSYRGTNVKGVVLALIASLAWTAGAVTLKLGVTQMDALAAAAIRTPASAIAITGLVMSRRRKREILQVKKYGRRNMVLAFGTGALSYGVASVSYAAAMQLIGAGKTVLITAVAPIFILPFSIVFLKERPTIYAKVGIIISVLGVGMLTV
jgi:drug/metabolite transporter (DMT)-like permease